MKVLTGSPALPWSFGGYLLEHPGWASSSDQDCLQAGPRQQASGRSAPQQWVPADGVLRSSREKDEGTENSARAGGR